MGHEIISEGNGIHECAMPRQSTMYSERIYAEGTIAACTDCGRYWYLVHDNNDGLRYKYATWYPVRWYHFGMKKRISDGD